MAEMRDIDGRHGHAFWIRRRTAARLTGEFGVTKSGWTAMVGG
jgi:hypothetical protein